MEGSNEIDVASAEVEGLAIILDADVNAEDAYDLSDLGQPKESIKKLLVLSLGVRRLSGLLPLVTNLPNLNRLTLLMVEIDPSAFNSIPDALMKLRYICVGGSSGCGLFSELLKRQECELRNLDFCGSSVDDNDLTILADSLTMNTRLCRLGLIGNEGISIIGWTTMLRLVCNLSSIVDITQSNHTLNSLGIFSTEDTELVESVLGIGNANLLHAALEMNCLDDKNMAARVKILLAHSEGHLNIGNSAIIDEIMPRILGWLTKMSTGTSLNFIQCRKAPLSQAEAEAARLDGIYHILLARPNLLTYADVLSSKPYESSSSLQSELGNGKNTNTMASPAVEIIGSVVRPRLALCKKVITGMLAVELLICLTLLGIVVLTFPAKPWSISI